MTSGTPSVEGSELRVRTRKLALLGHKTSDITTHYSQAEIQGLIDAIAKIAENRSRKSHALTLLRAVSGQ